MVRHSRLSGKKTLMLRRSELEFHRNLWRGVARKHGWAKKRMSVQVWPNDDGTIRDSVSFRPLKKDVVLIPKKFAGYRIAEDK
jgi:hypothetical protein